MKGHEWRALHEQILVGTLSDNPFSSRYIRPGAIDYVFPPGLSAKVLIEQFDNIGGWAQIVGAHGSGKSTLVAELVAELTACGRHATVFELHDGQRRMPSDWRQRVAIAGASIVIVDGYEQLSRWSRFWLKRQCTGHRLNLLVTAHRDVGLTTLIRTEDSLELAQAVVARLTTNDRPAVPPSVVATSFQAARGNIRETLFALYDYFEQNSPDRRAV